MWQSNFYNYSKRPTNGFVIGTLTFGGNQPIKVQSMATTNTNDVEESVNQFTRIVNAGGELVRFTVQGMKEVDNLEKIQQVIRERGIKVPLVADVHFNSKLADRAAHFLEKVRVNPGNYVSGVKRANENEYTAEEYREEYEKIRVRFVELLAICKTHNTTLRIGVNHGSLSDRMMCRWGNSVQGMVESCMEFLHICHQEDFHNVVISMKSSNTTVMIEAVRKLVKTMESIDYHYPIHLGVTEAGDGEDGRIKSAVGIGGLLSEGIGNTIRVSLSEEPEAEIPVAQKLVEYVKRLENHPPIVLKTDKPIPLKQFARRKTTELKNIGGEKPPVVMVAGKPTDDLNADYYFSQDRVYTACGKELPLFTKESYKKSNSFISFIKLNYDELDGEILEKLKTDEGLVVLFQSTHINIVGETRAFIHTLMAEGCLNPVVVAREYEINDLELFQIATATDFGINFVDKLADGLFISNRSSEISPAQIVSTSLTILQAARARASKTEFISCPSCGRTLFNLQTVVKSIKERTSHLTHLRIGIMGCIVNGPGEMADADYGYVGAGKGKISLYKKQECVKRNIAENEAVEALVNLIKENGDWIEPNEN